LLLFLQVPSPPHPVPCPALLPSQELLPSPVLSLLLCPALCPALCPVHSLLCQALSQEQVSPLLCRQTG
jgi:hypothetical protein